MKLFTGLALVLQLAAATVTAKQMNVLMLAVDDMRPQLECVDLPGAHKPTMHTPHMCSLAAQSLVLLRSNVAMATCSPSRTALLTGRRPGTTHVWDLFSYYRNVTGNFTSIPQYFLENGYYTAGMGKIFHSGTASGGGSCDVCKGADDVGYSWTDGVYFHGENHIDNPNAWLAVPANVTDHSPLQDTQTAMHAVDMLKNMTELAGSKPFFLAVGFHKPHLPFVFPEKYLDYYPESDIQLPDNPFAPWDMPEIAWQQYGETRSYKDVNDTGATGAINTTLPDSLTLELRRAYYSAVSYTDHNIGMVLAALSEYGYANNTVIVLFGDHGWQLGEHGEWDKHTNFDIATHAPVMVRVPGLTDAGIRTNQLTETVDIFPTLVELATGEQLPACPEDSSEVLTCTEGSSMAPLIADPNTPIKSASFSVYDRNIPSSNEPSDGPAHADTTFSWTDDDALGDSTPAISKCLSGGPRGEGCAMGYTMLTNEGGSTYRYTEWVNFIGPDVGFEPDFNTIYATELYNHTADPAENHNIFASVEGTALVGTLSTRLHTGYLGARL